MINLSELAIKSPEVSLFRKFSLMRDPYIYLAENIRDYKENISKIEFPWYKRKGFMLNSSRAYISIDNVRIDKSNKHNFFEISDSTGEDIMYWGDEFFSQIYSFEEAQKQQGLKLGDKIHNIYFIHIIDHELPLIIEVQKYPQDKPPKNNYPRKKSIKERLNEIIPIKETFPVFG